LTLHQERREAETKTLRQQVELGRQIRERVTARVEGGK